MNKEELIDVYKDVEARLDELIDKNVAGKIDDATFSIAVMANRLEKKMVPYHDELQSLNRKTDANLRLIISILSDKHLTPKEEQQVKEKLKRIKDIFNSPESGGAEKDQDIADTFDKIDEILLEILSNDMKQSPASEP